MCFCKALDNLVLMRQLQEVKLEMHPLCFGQRRDAIVRKVTQQLQKLHERDRGSKRINVFDVSESLFPRRSRYLSQTITIPPERTPPKPTVSPGG